jgi:hypothetical protein
MKHIVFIINRLAGMGGSKVWRKGSGDHGSGIREKPQVIGSILEQLAFRCCDFRPGADEGGGMLPGGVR